MDPLTAFSLAGTIVQFLDFGCKVLARSNEIYKSASGALSFVQEVDLATRDLSNISMRLRQPLDGLGVTQIGLDDQMLRDICKECQNLANEMLERLRSLKVESGNRRWASLREALKATWAESELSELTGRMTRFRQMLQTQILVSLRFEILSCLRVILS